MNNSLFKVVELLNDHKYHDGTSIGQELDITRAAVWKTIKKMEQYGIDVKSVKGKGYLLEEPLICLDEIKINSEILKHSIDLEILEKINSTNEYLKKHVISDNQTKVCMSEMQTHARGRLNRKWHAPFGKNISISFLYPFQGDISEMSGLSLVVGLAVIQAIDNTYELDKQLSVKWPNDIVVDDAKLAGILIELQGESNGYCNVIIGIGINVNMLKANNKQINQKWTSLQKLTGQYQDRNYLSSNVINTVMDYLNKFIKSDLKVFIHEWNERDCLFNKSITVVASNVTHRGIGAGINSSGHLLLKKKNGVIKSFSSGDTTLLK
jgi:BirA family biotin operon repressor/biotin-[acetyl-CoA-carboxylase] ligase